MANGKCRRGTTLLWVIIEIIVTIAVIGASSLMSWWLGKPLQFGCIGTIFLVYPVLRMWAL